MSVKQHSSLGRSGIWTAVLISMLALIISFLTAYYQVLKPFHLEIRVHPMMQIQHKTNFGLYVTVDLYNASPKNSVITAACIIIGKAQTWEDIYLLELNSFRVLQEDKVTYGQSEETLPILIESWKRHNKIMSFIFQADEQFPISQGIYNCELLLWDRQGEKAKFRERFKFDITSDVLEKYKENRKAGSTSLEPIYVVGYTPLKSRKLTTDEYNLLR